jgi:hypothetical protein
LDIPSSVKSWYQRSSTQETAVYNGSNINQPVL